MTRRRMYKMQERAAKARGIAFELTYEEWLTIWLESGRLGERGRRKGQYVMARYKDQGAYRIGNVSIILGQDNARDVWNNQGDLLRQKISRALKGRTAPNKGVPHTKETKMKMSRSATGAKRPYNAENARQLGYANRGKKHSKEFCQRNAARQLGTKRSDETRAKMSVARSIYWAKRRISLVKGSPND